MPKVISKKYGKMILVLVLICLGLLLLRWAAMIWG